MEPARESAIFGHFASLCFFKPANCIASLLSFLIGPLLIDLLSQTCHQFTVVLQVVIEWSRLNNRNGEGLNGWTHYTLQWMGWFLCTWHKSIYVH